MDIRGHPKYQNISPRTWCSRTCRFGRGHSRTVADTSRTYQDVKKILQSIWARRVVHSFSVCLSSNTASVHHGPCALTAEDHTTPRHAQRKLSTPPKCQWCRNTPGPSLAARAYTSIPPQRHAPLRQMPPIRHLDSLAGQLAGQPLRHRVGFFYTKTLHPFHCGQELRQLSRTSLRKAWQILQPSEKSLRGIQLLPQSANHFSFMQLYLNHQNVADGNISSHADLLRVFPTWQHLS